jgi:hypothetical protein
LSDAGIGIYEGGDAIRRFFEDWTRSFDKYVFEVQEVLDLDYGVVLLRYRDSGALASRINGGAPLGERGSLGSGLGLGLCRIETRANPSGSLSRPYGRGTMGWFARSSFRGSTCALIWRGRRYHARSRTSAHRVEGRPSEFSRRNAEDTVVPASAEITPPVAQVAGRSKPVYLLFRSARLWRVHRPEAPPH